MPECCIQNDTCLPEPVFVDEIANSGACKDAPEFIGATNQAIPQLVDMQCCIKAEKPEDYGYISWEYVHKALAAQQELPCLERIMPCMKYHGWAEYRSCQRCPSSIWDLNYYGLKMQARPNIKKYLVKGKRVELIVQETGEILEYTFGEGFSVGGALTMQP